MYLAQLDPHTMLNGQGALHAVTGGMAGKKTFHFNSFFDLVEYSGVKYQILKPHIDVREDVQGDFGKDFHVSRSGMGKPATCVKSDGSLEHFVNAANPCVQVYGVAELHLFTYADKLARYLVHKKDEGNIVVVEGLDRDFAGRKFPAMAHIMSNATTVDKHYGRCEKDLDGGKCGMRGEFSQRIVNGHPANYDDPIIMVGASEAYEVRCGNHHEVPGKPGLGQILESL